MRVFKRALLGLLLLNVLLVVAAQVAKRMLPAYGDDDSDVFAAVAAMDGAEIVNRSNTPHRRPMTRAPVTLTMTVLTGNVSWLKKGSIPLIK